MSHDVSPIDDIIARHSQQPGALLPLLHDVQHMLGYIPADVVPLIATALNLSRAEVHGVVTFYADFRTAPPAARVLKLCVAEACQARGMAATQARLSAALGVAMGDTCEGGRLALEPIYCLGLCASGPAALLDDQPRARLEGDRLDALVAELTT